ncbi:hypothetical protein OG444_07495 [Streptomyces sp. NBC_01232]|uniref:hypothetical protein n=1 Tax=unclassified Streptomyces TaxID=2593676 RepID=UPI002E0FBCA7|nr:hypothetical protein OG444_07495 [Streptomyces sp. NBC_01232]
MRSTPTLRTVAAGFIALGALLFTPAASQDGAPSLSQIRADGPLPVTVPTGSTLHRSTGPIDPSDVTWGN